MTDIHLCRVDRKMKSVSVAPQLSTSNLVYYCVPVSVAYRVIRTGIKYFEGMDIHLSYQQVTEASKQVS
jgi:hypothetical protein